MASARPSRVSRAKATPKALRTRQHIYDVSLALFMEKGFDETSMRDIAGRAGLSLGSTYYHYDSKQALVYQYYVESQAEAEQRNEQTCAATTSFADRMHDLFAFKLGQLEGVPRGFIVVLARSALDPANPLSPFGPETREVRDAAIEMMERVVAGSDLKVHKELRPHLPRVLWLYLMGVLYLWIQDRSTGQRRTHRVVDASLALLVALLPLTARRLPGMTRTVRQLARLLEDVAFWRPAPEAERP